jgi:hypothetical protein
MSHTTRCPSCKNFSAAPVTCRKCRVTGLRRRAVPEKAMSAANGITRRQIRELGGVDRLMGMSEDARAVMLGIAKRARKGVGNR